MTQSRAWEPVNEIIIDLRGGAAAPPLPTEICMGKWPGGFCTGKVPAAFASHLRSGRGRQAGWATLALEENVDRPFRATRRREWRR